MCLYFIIIILHYRLRRANQIENIKCNLFPPNRLTFSYFPSQHIIASLITHDTGGRGICAARYKWETADTIIMAVSIAAVLIWFLNIIKL